MRETRYFFQNQKSSLLIVAALIIIDFFHYKANLKVFLFPNLILQNSWVKCIFVRDCFELQNRLYHTDGAP